jgi:chromosome segregation ATPase
MPPGVETAVNGSHRTSPTLKRASPAAPYHSHPTPPSWQSPSSSAGPPSGSPATGKTSKVIERLTAENERLRRELNSERAGKEEAVRGEKALRTKVEELVEKNNTLTNAFDSHDAALARKERRIDDLKLALDHEVARRKRAEEREAEMSQELGEVKSKSAGEVARAKNIALQKENEYETLSRTYVGLESQVERLRLNQRTTLEKVAADAREKEAGITRYEVLYDSMRQRMETIEELLLKSNTTLGEYKATSESSVAEYQENLSRLAQQTKVLRNTVDEPFEHLRSEHARRWTVLDEQRAAMETTLGEMKWAIGVAKSRPKPAPPQ